MATTTREQFKQYCLRANGHPVIEINIAAAQFCEGLTIGGYTDWYLPARDELEVCYRNLKPSTSSNTITSRSKSSYTYPEGNDGTDTMGLTETAVPQVQLTPPPPSVPGQTAVAAFRSGGTEAFDTVNYWSSSEFSSSDAWFQDFGNGGQPSKNKTDNNKVRAVRRLAV